VKGKFLFVLLLSIMLALLGVWGAYITVKRNPGFIGPVVMSNSRGALSYVSIHSPGWIVMNSSFNGKGRLIILDQFSNRTIFTYNVSEHFAYPIVLPREGSYAVYVLNGSLTFSAYYPGVYPTLKVQKAMYMSITILAFVLALWRWRA